MEYRPLGQSGVEISRIGLGGIELGPAKEGEPDVDRAVRVIETAIDAGINWLDTSEGYIDTRNESLIGEALARAGSELLVATKVCPQPAGSGFLRDQVHAACRASLRRLHRERVDLYLLHWPDDTGVPLEETWGAMEELVEAGLVRAIGLCNYSIDDIERCHAQRPVDATQDGLSLIDFLDNRPLIARCGELGVAVTIYDALGGGILGGRPPEQVLAVWERLYEHEALIHTHYYQHVLAPGRAERSWAVARGLKPIADGLGATPAQIALAWGLHQPGVSATLAGSGSPRHVRENAEANDIDLAATLDKIEALIPFGPAFVASV